MWETLLLIAAAAVSLLVLGAYYLRVAGGNGRGFRWVGAIASVRDSWSRGCGPTNLKRLGDSRPRRSEHVDPPCASETRGDTATEAKPAACSLLQMQPGLEATVLALTGGREFQAKLVSMGFNVGCSVTVLKNRVGGTGMLVAAGQTRLAIGNAVAERIVVAARHAPDGSVGCRP